MTVSLDLNLLPVARYSGSDYLDLLGLYFTEPLRRSVRNRSQDRLLLYLVFEGNAPLPMDQRDKVLADLAKLYYQTPGSVTAAMRQTADELNRLMLDRNRQLGANRQGIGCLAQVVWREEQFTIGQSGPLQAFLIAEKGVSHFHDPLNSGNGLGLTRTAAISFSQAVIKPNDTLLLAALPYPDWSPAVVSGAYGQGPESLRRRLYQHISADLNAVAIQAKPGKGKFFLLKPVMAQAVPPSAGTSPSAVPPSGRSQTPQPPISPVAAAVISAAQGDSSSPALAEQSAQPTDESVAELLNDTSSVDQGADAPLDVPVMEQKVAKAPVEQAAPRPQSKASLAAPGKIFASIGAALSTGGKKFLAGLRQFVGRMLPDETFLNIPSSVMALIAIAVPVVIVTAASMVYFRLGRAAQFELFSAQAKQVAMQAMEKSDLASKRADLGAALSLLSKAEGFAVSPDSVAEIQSMQVEVRNALDELDFVKRVKYESAIIKGLPVTSNIIRMVATTDDLYLLDQTNGSVMRASLTDQGYDLDYTFQCASGNYGEVTVNSIIDISEWPAGYEPAATVLAVDSAGNVLYCAPNELPVAVRLGKPEESEEWGNIIQAALDHGNLYVLDLLSNGVWFYRLNNFIEHPTLFFDDEIPPMQDVIDMLVDQDDLYLLQSDGTMMICGHETLTVAPTHCAVQSYIDRRPGRENLPLIPSVPFQQVLSIPPPDPSLFLLEPDSHAFYHFSLRNLSFQKQYLPEQPLPARNASAFAINYTRRFLYLALGNQVFYAAMP